MIVLTETTDNLQLVLSGAPASQQPRAMSCWRDINTTDYTPGRTLINANSSTDVNIVPAPSSGFRRVVDFISIFNQDTASVTATVKLDANGTEFNLVTVTLAPGERLEYADGVGFRVLNTTGAAKTALNQGASPTASTFSTAVLASNVINNNAVANTIQDVTGLSFPVVANRRTYFEFNILYDAAATTTGSRWSISGPTFSRLVYGSEYALTTTTTTRNALLTAYDLPAASNATSAVLSGNLAIIWGFIEPTADGNVTARFASEVISSAITALAGSFVRYQQMN